jgi:DNA-binding transcriptional LysR family regulator
MSAGRGTDQATEERRIRSREENDPLGRWLEDLFDGTAEASVVGIPALLFVVLTGDLRASSAGMGALVVTAWLVAAYRNGRLDVGPGWPPFSPLYVVVRGVWYNATYLAALFVGVSVAVLPLGPPALVVAGLVGGAVAGVSLLAFPYAAAGVERVRTV